jgi:hypothetical protein
MATYERLDYGSSDGSQWGDATARIAFYGGTPVAQTTIANISTASQISTVISSLIVDLGALGLFSTVTYVDL